MVALAGGGDRDQVVGGLGMQSYVYGRIFPQDCLLGGQALPSA